jgi:hypothetical protein
MVFGKKSGRRKKLCRQCQPSDEVRQDLLRVLLFRKLWPQLCVQHNKKVLTFALPIYLGRNYLPSVFLSISLPTTTFKCSLSLCAAKIPLFLIFKNIKQMPDQAYTMLFTFLDLVEVLQS